MSRKFYLFLALLIVASMALAACGGATEAEPDCASEDVLCVGLVTDVGEVDDKSFNQASWEALQQAETELGAMIDYVETKDAKDYAENMGIFIDAGYDVVVTSGAALGEATKAAALANPDVHFIGVDQPEGADVPNFTGVLFKEDQAGFMAGALAALLTQTDVVAGVYGTDIIIPVVAFNEGYAAGAKYINPDITVISTYHPGGLDVAFTDPEWGATTAAQAIDNGADVIFGAGGKTGNGALIEVAGHEGLYCIGVDQDQWYTVPEAHSCLVSSAIKAITPSVFAMIQAYVDGDTPEGNFYGIAGLAPYHDFEDVIPDDVKAQVEQIGAGLQDGTIETGWVAPES